MRRVTRRASSGASFASGSREIRIDKHNIYSAGFYCENLLLCASVAARQIDSVLTGYAQIRSRLKARASFLSPSTRTTSSLP